MYGGNPCPPDRLRHYACPAQRQRSPSLHSINLNLSENQLQSLDLEMPHVQPNLDLSIVLLVHTMSFIPWHRFFKEIDPFSRINLDTRSSHQSSSRSGDI
jgi:hypothetical protein